jgi:hypothetical protein
MKRYVWILLGVFLMAQAIRPSRTLEAVDQSSDLIAVTHPSAEVEGILRTACYDCHSGQPRYPWYVNITPVNWWLQSHIDEGREHFDVSAWGMITEKKRSHWAEEALEMVQEGEMPLNSYTWTHADARLSDAQRQQLVAFFKPLHTLPEGSSGRRQD